MRIVLGGREMKLLLSSIVFLCMSSEMLADTLIPDFGYIVPEDVGPNYVVVDRVGEHVFDYYEPTGEVLLQVVESSDGVRRFDQQTWPEYSELELDEAPVFVIASPPQALPGDRVLCEIPLRHSPWNVSLNSEVGYVAFVERWRDGEGGHASVAVHALTGEKVFESDLESVFDGELLPQAPDNGPGIFGLLMEWRGNSLVIATQVDDESNPFSGRYAVREIHSSDWSTHHVGWTETVRRVMSSSASDANKLHFLETWCGSTDYEPSELWRIVPLATLSLTNFNAGWMRIESRDSAKSRASRD